MTIKTHKIAALKRKTGRVSTELEAILHKQNSFEEAVYLLNDYLRQDTVLQSILGEDFNIFPVVAEEPFAGVPSFPYIRYSTVPTPGPIWRARTDIVRYMVGDKNYAQAGRVVERLIALTNMDGSETIFPIKNNKFKIQSLLFLGGTAATNPDQEDGVMERGVNVAYIYTVIS